ncbi:hypothetical protein [Bradyrhizobium sp. AZCC 2289]|uniref:hypothetical protein n=1 Tax=Bradyrhizobium sp. AZCC 2289 TaxID=3117026 RepID=UPI002FF19AE5
MPLRLVGAFILADGLERRRALFVAQRRLSDVVEFGSVLPEGRGATSSSSRELRRPK